ncbi:hypothetical protein BJ684DRAFT_18775 [Piptocephalis cylindrospora]|uniref:YHYH domain-containing protein n=1 Tax=Piptocephalis cylindrospora TaxID=1907219 RepID=A0A4P9Y6V2_9FUNG|nr:hypothetical protein BJ684DRAFT_18775 [Piptocephalis cylindrospora]|eukprot:RKP14846.1 hypothetical protein BJ684DRAFT_18775 [Piptocephalis cylindrospora]
MNRTLLALTALVLAVAMTPQVAQAAPPTGLVKCATHPGVKGFHCHDPISDVPVDPSTGRPIDPSTGRIRELF